MLFVVELHCLSHPLQPGLLEDCQFLACQVVAFQENLLCGQNVALLVQLNPHHIHQRLNLSQLIVLIHLLVYIVTVLYGRRALAYLKYLLEVFVLGRPVLTVCVEAVPFFVDFVVLKGLFVLVDDAEALLAFFQFEGVLHDLLRDDFLL